MLVFAAHPAPSAENAGLAAISGRAGGVGVDFLRGFLYFKFLAYRHRPCGDAPFVLIFTAHSGTDVFVPVGGGGGMGGQGGLEANLGVHFRY